jgi:hypothetical protein
MSQVIFRNESSAVHSLRSSWWTPGQVRWAIARMLLLTTMLCGLYLFNSPAGKLLLTHPLGVKMLIGSLCIAGLGLAIEFAIWLGINYWLPPDDANCGVLRLVLQGILGAVLFVVFFMPVIFVCINGPAVIQIMETMTKP